MILNQSNFLLAWGWNAFFEQNCRELKGFIVGRVVGEERDRWKLQVNTDQNVWGTLSGKTRHESDSRTRIPSVGDWVICQYAENQSLALIREVWTTSIHYRKNKNRRARS